MSSSSSLEELSSTPSNYKKAIAYLFGLEKIGIKFGLENIKYLLHALGNPQNKYPAIHIAGTNGKGSTAQFLTSILAASGRRVGTYTSPHLIDFCERIQINGIPISHEIIIEGISLIRQSIEKRNIPKRSKQSYPTYFEVSTALAFWCFARTGIDIAVVETGMGGRLDATNVIDPIVSVITNIALEHQSYLGDTLELIAYEKSGIIKPGRPLVLGEKEPDLIRFFHDRCKKIQAKFYLTDGNWDILEENEQGSRFSIRRSGKGYDDLKIRLLGRFQVENAFLAVRVWEVLNSLGLDIPEESMRQGLKSAKWPGRMHILRKKPLVIADGAHNPQAADSLLENLPRFLEFHQIILVFGCMRDKDVPELLAKFLHHAKRVFISRAKNDRAEEPENILDLIDPANRDKTYVIKDIRQAVERAVDEAEEDDLVLITGSLYIVGDVLPLFQMV